MGAARRIIKYRPSYSRETETLKRASRVETLPKHPTVARGLSLAIGLCLTLVSLALSAARPTPAAAEDRTRQIAIAAENAGHAATATELGAAHFYLRQAIHCRVGPYDKAFDAKGPNPCQALGIGALYDSTEMEQRQMLELAVTQAEWGLTAGDLPTAVKNAAIAEVTPRKAI